MSGFGAIMGQSFIVKLTSPVGVKAQVELILPAKLETRLGESVVAKLCPRPSLGQVRGMRGDFVTDDARTDIFFVRKAKVFFGGYVAEHRSSVPTDLCRADRAGDVIVPGSDVGHERSQRVERCFEALLQLFVHVFANSLHRYVTWALDHHLDIVFPRSFCQFSKGT